MQKPEHTQKANILPSIYIFFYLGLLNVLQFAYSRECQTLYVELHPYAIVHWVW